MFDRELWTFVNSFADWFSAFGTIGAVMVALYLARRDSRIRLNVVVGTRVMIRHGGRADQRPLFFSLEVTNVGRRPALITALTMRAGFPFGNQWVMLPPMNTLSADVPTTITDGEGAHYLLGWEDFERVNHKEMRGEFAGPLGWLRIRLFRIGVSTSAGGISDARVETELARRLLALARQESPTPRTKEDSDGQTR